MKVFYLLGDNKQQLPQQQSLGQAIIYIVLTITDDDFLTTGSQCLPENNELLKFYLQNPTLFAA